MDSVQFADLMRCSSACLSSSSRCRTSRISSRSDSDRNVRLMMSAASGILWLQRRWPLGTRVKECRSSCGIEEVSWTTSISRWVTNDCYCIKDTSCHFKRQQRLKPMLQEPDLFFKPNRKQCRPELNFEHIYKGIMAKDTAPQLKV